MRIAFANVAGGRLVDDNNRYVDADQTHVFGTALAELQPDVLLVTELDCDSDQLERLAAAAMPGRAVHPPLSERFSNSHIPGVDRIGVGIASSYPITDLGRIDLPDPPFEMLHWRTGEPLDWHAKGFVVARLDLGEQGTVDIAAGQVCPVHMARSVDGVEYTYSEEPARSYGKEMTAHLARELEARGVRRLIVAGDLNMQNPRDFFTEQLGLVDGFSDPLPATTPDGRSIDRIFTSPSLAVGDVEVVRLAGADHYPVGCQVTARPSQERAIGMIREQDLARPKSGGPSRSGGARRGPTGRGPR
ncbi:endonuclease/exonuclease/phosphatase family protein [Kribbella sp. NPDC050124]|uniref:endonuclease/exonuclease/phosphatase family protein n=1 Tax=Kribbella sp. NPDC050124 TaxID=3364114 RepID=UPI0037A97A64